MTSWPRCNCLITWASSRRPLCMGPPTSSPRSFRSSPIARFAHSTVGSAQNPLLRQPICGGSGRRKHQNADRHHARSDARDDGGGLGSFFRAAGNLDNVATVLAELASSLDPKRLLAAVRWSATCPMPSAWAICSTSVARDTSRGPLHGWIERQSCHPVPLRAGRPVAGAAEDRRWHVLVNEAVEVEARFRRARHRLAGQRKRGPMTPRSSKTWR